MNSDGRRHRAALVALISLSGWLGSGCGHGTEADAAGTAAPFENDPGVMLALQTIPYLPVEAVGDVPAGAFQVTQRTPKIGQHPCSACHKEPLSQSTDSRDIERRRAHVDIQLAHAPADIMDCRTCHAPEDVQRLRMQTGKQVALDHSYQLCAQCHFEQVRDWGGGAHGKRVGGWRGERVIMNCTECHDPHSPGFDVRWPRMTPSIPRTGRIR